MHIFQTKRKKDIVLIIRKKIKETYYVILDFQISNTTVVATIGHQRILASNPILRAWKIWILQPKNFWLMLESYWTNPDLFQQFPPVCLICQKLTNFWASQNLTEEMEQYEAEYQRCANALASGNSDPASLLSGTGSPNSSLLSRQKPEMPQNRSREANNGMFSSTDKLMSISNMAQVNLFSFKFRLIIFDINIIPDLHTFF